MSLRPDPLEEYGQQLATRIDAVLGELRYGIEISARYAQYAQDPQVYSLLTGSFDKLNRALDAFWDQVGEPSVLFVLEGVEWCWGSKAS